MGWTTGYTRETSIPDARPRTANHLARRNHPSAQHSTHAAKRHSYNPTAQFLTARDLFFHPFLDLYIFHREPVGLLGVFFGLSFFRCNQVSVELWIYFGTYIYSEFGCVGIDTFPRIPPTRALVAKRADSRFWVLWLCFWTCTFFRWTLVSFEDSVFSVSPLGLSGFLDL
jgi:hypothetical protein